MSEQTVGEGVSDAMAALVQSANKANIFADAKNPVDLLGMAMGYSSICWENVSGAGEFSSEKAQLGLEHAVNRLFELSAEQVAREEEERDERGD